MKVFTAPFATSPAIASTSAGLPFTQFVSTIATAGWEGKPTVIQRYRSRATSFRSSVQGAVMILLTIGASLGIS